MKPSLPDIGSTVTAICGCIGIVLSLHGNAVHVQVRDPCPGPDHPGTPVTSSIVEHFTPDEILPATVQLALYDPQPTITEMEHAA